MKKYVYTHGEFVSYLSKAVVDDVMRRMKIEGWEVVDSHERQDGTIIVYFRKELR